MLGFKTYIYNCKYGNRKYCGNSQFNTYSVCSAILYNCTYMLTEGVIQTVPLSIQ